MSLLSYPWSSSLIGGAMGVTLSFLAARALGPLGWMDLPDERRQHQRPTPRTAGLALFAGFFLLRVFGISTFQLDPVQWVGLFTMVGLGAWDDRFGLPAKPKALVGFLVACLLAWDQAHRLDALGHPIFFAGLQVPNQPFVTLPLLVGWYWGVPQAFNLADGLDGFALGLAGLIFVASGHGPLAHPVLWGLLVSAFLLNFPRAFHFLGDAGSLGLGTLAAILVMGSAVRTDSALALWTCAYLVVDCSTVVISRLVRHRPLGTGDRSHLHHLLLDGFRGRAWMATPALLLLSMLPQMHVWAGRTFLDEGGLLLLMGLGGFAVVRSAKAPKGPRVMTAALAELQRQPSGPVPIQTWESERTSA
ncbi:MAG TPA: MraY family glycosyltransferase [Holophagaceae bacterium]|nr:MraY family glycosyltransferase [Holophagaceae bacterium]